MITGFSAVRAALYSTPNMSENAAALSGDSVDGGAPTVPFWAVFVPLYVTEAIDLVRACVRLRPSAHDAERAAVTNMLLYATMRARLIGLGVEEIELHDEQAISLYPSTVSHLPLVSVHIGDTIRDKNDASCVAPECEVEKSYLWTGESGASVTTH